MPLPVAARPHRVVFWLTTLFCFLAVIPTGMAIPDYDPPPGPPPPPPLRWMPPPFLLSRTLPPLEVDGQTHPRLAADFEPWNAVLRPNGYYYGYVNDGAAPNGLIYNLRPDGYRDPWGEQHPPGESHAVYRFPRLSNAPVNRLQGSLPHGGMAVGQDGTLYGRLSEGGVFGAGLLFKMAGGIPQAIHHFEEKGNAGKMIVATDGDIYSATVPEDPSQPSWVFRLSKYRAPKKIPAPPGEIVSLVETSDGRIILGTWIANTNEGTLWRLNEADEFELFVDHLALNFAIPAVLLPQPAGELFCLTNRNLIRISPEGAATKIWNFSWPNATALPTLLLRGGISDGHERFTGTVRSNGTDVWFGIITTLKPEPSFNRTTLASVPDGVHATWMDIFPSRVLVDRGGKSYMKPPNYEWAVDRGHLPPVARDDGAPAGSFTRGADGLPRITVPVLRNDIDPEWRPLKIVAVGTATHGTVKIDRTAQFVTYTANSAPVQNDSFTYTTSDGQKTATARVFVRTNPAGSYSGEVIPALPDPAVQTPAGSLLVNMKGDRSLTATLNFEGRLYRFTRRFDTFGQCAAVLMLDPDLQQSLAIQLLLRADGTKWAVDAVIQKDNTAKFTASCAPVPR